MANSKVQYTADGSTQSFAVTFPFISRSHVSVEVDGSAATFTWNNDSQITIASPTLSGGEAVLLIRKSSRATRLVDYVDGSNLTETDLDLDSKQAFYMAQESLDELVLFNDDVKATSGYVLVADGTDFKSVAISGDITISTAGAVTIGSGTVESAMIAADAITGAKIADDAIDSEHYAAGSIDVAHMSANSVDSDQYVNGSIDLAHMSANSVDSDQYVDGSIDNAHMSANSVDSDQYVDASIDTDHLSTSSVTTAKIADDAITTAKVTDANITLAKIVSASASNKVLGRVASGAGVFEEVTLQTTLSSTDEAIPTSKAVRDDIVDIVNAVGGFVAIASEVTFPNANPDPDDGAGTVVSIANAGGVVVDGAGESTTGRTVGGSTVTITGIPATYQSATIADGLGMQVISTTTLNTYTYHKIIAKEGDTNTVATSIANVNTTAGSIANVNTTAGSIANVNIVGAAIANVNTTAGAISNVNSVAGAITNINTTVSNLSNINRFAEEYTISSSAPGSPSEGDLWYDSSANVLKVHNGSSFVAVTSATAGITDVVDDTTPQLGGNLDLQTYTLSNVSLANGGFYSNPNTITADATVTTAALKNMFLMGQISVNDTYTWTIAGDGVLSII